MAFRPLVTIFAGFLTVSIAFSIRYGYGMLLPEMIPVLGISKTEAGLVYSIYFITYTIFTPIFGAVSDRFNYRALLTVFSAVLGIGALLNTFATNMIQVGFFFAIAGLGHSSCWAPVVVLVQKWVPDNRRGTALSVVAAGVGTGVFVWGFLLPFIVSIADWRMGWFALGITALSIALINSLLIRNPSQETAGNKRVDNTLRHLLIDYGDSLKQPVFWLVGLAYLLIGSNVIILFAFLPVYSREVLGVAYEISTRFISVIAFFGIIGQLGLGSLSDKVGRIKVMILSSAIMAAGSLGILFTESTTVLFLLVGVYGVGYGTVWPVYAAAALDLFPKSLSGGIVGLWTLFLGIGSIIAPIACGYLIDTSDSYFWVFSSAGIAGVISLILLIPTISSFRMNTSVSMPNQSTRSETI